MPPTRWDLSMFPPREKMMTTHFKLAGLAALALVLAGCAAASSSGGTAILGISSPLGALSGSGTSWSFDAGTVPQYATATFTFTVTNTGSADFTATGSQSFSPSGDLADSLSGSFSVAAHSSNTFTVSFSPSAKPGSAETGSLTLTPPDGAPISISLTVTPDASFQVYDPNGTQLVPSIQGSWTAGASETLTITNGTRNATITLTGAPVSVSGTGYTVGSQPVNGQLLPTSTIGPGNAVTFGVADGNGRTSSGNVGTITISGINSVTNTPFSFVASVVD
jgi:hypothetical protein